MPSMKTSAESVAGFQRAESFVPFRGFQGESESPWNVFWLLFFVTKKVTLTYIDGVEI